MDLLLAKDIEKKISQGLADYKAGRVETLSKESTAKHIAELEKKYLVQHSKSHATI